MENCPRCKSSLLKDQKSIRCSSKDCMYHLNKEEKAEFLKARAKKKKKTNSLKNESLSQSERAKNYYYRKKALNQGYITIKEAAIMKNVSKELIICNLKNFHFRKNPLSIKYDSTFINFIFTPRKKRLRKK